MTKRLTVNNSSAEKKTATHSEKQYTATTTVCATTHMDIHPPKGKTGAKWEHTNTRSVSKYYAIYVFLQYSKFSNV